ncbi:hypothetical protein, partial [Nocardia brasiliensis]|uniref:hypothetical protein n=1 Tax=Nocardia brasiliensis TaxID=37326 RepID=UPI0024552682
MGERDPRRQPGQTRAEAVVDAVPEREMAGRAAGFERGGIREMTFVTVGARHHPRGRGAAPAVGTPGKNNTKTKPNKTKN